MLCIEELINLDPFQQLSQEQLEWVCDRAQTVELSGGEVLSHEGDPACRLFILVKGKINITRRSEGVEIPIGQHEAPSFFGEIPVLTDEPAPVTMRALTNCHLYQLKGEDFRKLLHECRNFERMVFRIMERRMRGLESFIRGREKMAALGTLAAGLAHELNNPASALVRTLGEMPAAILELQRMNLVYGQRNVEEAHTQDWLRIRDQGYDAILNNRLDPVTLSDRENVLLEWLEDYGVKQAWKLAEPLAEGGVEVETLDKMMERWRNDETELREMGLHWLSLSFEVMSMIKHGLRGAERISELVQAMKSYSYLDQGVQQEVDVHQGLEDTLRLFVHKLKCGIQVQRNYEQHLPKILAYGSELNQVWTNLIDNAIDAMDGKGLLEITTHHCDRFAHIDIIDSGSGIPPEIKTRIFEPFFTTKSVGRGSGLGLETVRRIVENRHHGTLSFESQPGRTCFTICLPKSAPLGN
ncbi:ATP-binding protein [Nostoc sp. ATCC 53789]|uniref:ATP-binding protein n=1 Tax=Nostoc sp. ATCC 53789 TaxID=76335 RepID=UPI000DECA553|nr:ATP-binding protein [Nostoc sp. ATCC 53789]QHG14990.1 cyclic nucleotide-binding domain-containing protein [Nostoc sp. ATCC 53789]RCJ34686.1 histidine kinase [Nostoc sp. ATCC 53789]